MKTLDEVIESITTQSGLEIRNVRKPERDRFWVDRDTYNDALHYLKEYQTLQYGYVKAMADLENNPPLSWDELKRMEGKPVWMECENFFCPKWVILTNVYDYKAMFIGDRIVDSELKDEMGDVWQVYRKERK